MEETLLTDLEDSYGLRCSRMTPVGGGWLNQKWKTESNRGTLLIKQYSHERFNRQQLQRIESALQRQILLWENGFPCPRILPCKGRAIRTLEDGTDYMVMEFCPGRIESCETVTEAQMEDLGCVCGRMHREFSGLPVEGVRGYPLDGDRLLRSLWDNFHARMGEADRPGAFQEAVLGQRAILQALGGKTLLPGRKRMLPTGIGHEDFSPDNMLFQGQGVTAILDFDRNQYTYVWHDLGRAVLSFALRDGIISQGLVRAFVDGYASQLPLELEDIVDALKITWCLEAPWWIVPRAFASESGKILRFKDELVWLTSHWFELESLV